MYLYPPNSLGNWSTAMLEVAHMSIVSVYEGKVMGQSPLYDCNMAAVAVSTL